MADWDDLRRSLENQPVNQPPLSALRERRRRRQQRKAIAATCAVVMIGSATGLAVLGETGRDRVGPTPQAVPTVLSQIVNSDRLPPPKDYQDYVVTDVDFVSKGTGWAIGLRCVGDACDVATWRSDDGGQTWGAAVPVATRVPRASYHEEDPSGGAARSIRMIDGQHGYAYNPDLYFTDDGARTWRRMPQPSKVTSVSMHGTSVWVAERGCAKDVDCDLVVRAGELGGELRDLDVPETNGARALVRRADERQAYLVAWDAPEEPRAAFHRTGDGGRTWTQGTMPCTDATAVAMSARVIGVLYLVCSSDDTRRAFVSGDDGGTWRRLADPPADGVVTDLLAETGAVYLTTQTPGRIYLYSHEQWTPADVPKAYGYGGLDAPAGDDVFAMGDAGELWVGSETAWRRLTLPPASRRAPSPPPSRGLADPSVEWADVTFLDARRGWVVGRSCAEQPCHTVLRRTTDGGESWTPVPTPWRQPEEHSSTRDEVRVTSVAFADDRNGWLVGDRLYATHDGGETWREADSGEGPVSDRVVPRGGAVWALGFRNCTSPCKQVVLRGSVGSDDLRPVTSPNVNRGARLAAYDGDHAFVVSHDDVMAATSDGGRTWTTSTAPCRIVALSSPSPRSVWALCDGPDENDAQAVAVSDDDGKTWRTTPLPTKAFHMRELVAVSPTVAWGIGVNPALFVTRDGGRTWTASPGVGGYVTAMAFAGPDHGWLLWGNALYRLRDGNRWERLG